jgi:hypothetical protein
MTNHDEREVGQTEAGMAGSAQSETYEAPAIQSFTPDELLEVLGPAQGYGGASSPSDRRQNRGHRLFPGLR